MASGSAARVLLLFDSRGGLTEQLAEEIAGLPPVHVQVTKRQLMMARPRGHTYQNEIAFPQALQGLMKLEDTKEAAAAFAEKRKPIFKGK